MVQGVMPMVSWIANKVSVNQGTYPVGEGNDVALGLRAVDTTLAVDHRRWFCQLICSRVSPASSETLKPVSSSAQTMKRS